MTNSVLSAGTKAEKRSVADCLMSSHVIANALLAAVGCLSNAPSFV